MRDGWRCHAYGDVNDGMVARRRRLLQGGAAVAVK